MNELGKNIECRLTKNLLFDITRSLRNDNHDKSTIDFIKKLQNSIWINLGNSLYNSVIRNSLSSGIEDGLKNKDE